MTRTLFMMSLLNVVSREFQQAQHLLAYHRTYLGGKNFAGAFIQTMQWHIIYGVPFQAAILAHMVTKSFKSLHFRMSPLLELKCLLWFQVIPPFLTPRRAITRPTMTTKLLFYTRDTRVREQELKITSCHENLSFLAFLKHQGVLHR